MYNLPLTKIGEKTKMQMTEPIESVIICALQNFKIAGRLNPVKMETEDDRVLNILKWYKNVVYRLTLLGLLFPASVKNDTEKIFITCRELNDTKKALINVWVVRSNWSKKTSNWQQIKGHSLWINVTFEEQKEINIRRHLCFPTLNDLLSFSMNLIEDHCKEITFEDSEKKISILNFKIDVFLRWIES